MIDKIVLATGNKGKVKEFASLFEKFSIEVTPQSEFAVPDVPETGTTFVENAIIKARHAAALTGLPAIADDSGLAVDVLGGSPGIYSSRYYSLDEKTDKAIEKSSWDNDPSLSNDQKNINKLLHALQNKTNRKARFLCVLVFMRHKDDPTPIICQGEWHGEIASTRVGEGGFGYDPVFWLPEQNQSAAQLDKASKNAQSHRGKALKQLLEQMAPRYFS